jgi:hypothetical protein
MCDLSEAFSDSLHVIEDEQKIRRKYEINKSESCSDSVSSSAPIRKRKSNTKLLNDLRRAVDGLSERVLDVTPRPPSSHHTSQSSIFSGQRNSHTLVTFVLLGIVLLFATDLVFRMGKRAK